MSKEHDTRDEDSGFVLLSDTRLQQVIDAIKLLMEEIPPKYIPQAARNTLAELKEEAQARGDIDPDVPWRFKNWLLRNVIYSPVTARRWAKILNVHENTIRNATIDLSVNKTLREERHMEEWRQRGIGNRPRAEQILALAVAARNGEDMTQAGERIGIRPQSVRFWLRKMDEFEQSSDQTLDPGARL